MSWKHADFILGGLDLNAPGGDYVVTAFEEMTSPKEVIWGSGDVTHEGRARGDVGYPNKTFTLTLSIRPQDDTSSLETCLRDLYDVITAVDDEENTVWFVHRPAADATWTTTRQIRVLHADGLVPTDQKMWKSRHLSAIELRLECEPAWRGTETTIVDGVTIHNANDDTRDNYVDISNLVPGDLPALARIECLSLDGNFTAWRIAVATGNAPPCLEWESLSGSWGAQANDASCSGGKRRDFSSCTTDWQSCGQMTFTTVGNFGLYRLFARVYDEAAAGGNLYLRARWGITSTANNPPEADSEVIGDQVQVRPTRYNTALDINGQIWVDLPLGSADFRYNTWYIDSRRPAYFSIKLEAKRTSGTEGLRIDRLYLMPLDEAYCFVGRTAGLSYAGETLRVSSIADKAYLLDSSGYIRLFPPVEGQLIKLAPTPDIGTVRLYFLWEEQYPPTQSVIQSGGIDRRMTVTVVIVPRYL